MYTFNKVYNAQIIFEVYDNNWDLQPGDYPWVLTQDGKLGFIIDGEGLQLIENSKGWCVRMYAEGKLLCEYYL